MTQYAGLFVGFGLWYLSVGFGVGVAYHRVLTHRAARLARPVLYALVLAGVAAGPPAEWVGNHRRHHRHSDGEADPHSPSRLGFWQAHCGWYLGIRSRLGCVLYACAGPLRLVVDAALRPVAPHGQSRFAPDVLEDPFLRWLSTRSGFVSACALQLTPFAVATSAFGAVGFGAAWAFSVVMYNVGDAVDSLLHLTGRREFACGDASRNSTWLGLLALGEGYHNGHHAFPESARSGLLPGEFDASYLLLRGLARVGLASDVQTPSPSALHAKRLSS